MITFRQASQAKMALVFWAVCALVFLGGGFYVHAQVAISWAGSPDPDVAGYKIYFGPQSGRYDTTIVVGSFPEYRLDQLPGYSPIFFAVTAYDTAYNESDYSNEANFVNNGLYFALHSNYPNPFNPVTTIPFSLFHTQMINMTVYDVLGRQVKCLLKGLQDVGHYEVVWSGEDEAGFPVANGVYFCRLLVGDFCLTQKLILMR